MRRLVRLVPFLAAAMLCVPASASAGILTQTAGDCATPTLSQVFLPWGDLMNYTPAPGATAESTDGWASLTGDAAIAPGNEPWNIAGTGASHLALPSGSSATTDTMCVGIEYPTIRFFAKSSGTGLLSSLRVDAITETSTGALLTTPVGYVLPSGAWTVTAPYVVAANLLPLLPGDLTPVRFTFTPQGSGTWAVDDVFVDPYSGR